MAGKTVKEARLNIRLAKSINDRLERVAEAAGQQQGVMAGLALAAGLRSLENTFLPPDPAVLNALGQKMLELANSDIDEQIAVASAEAAPGSVGSG